MIQDALHTAPAIADTLVKRHWHLLVAPEAVALVTSDRPVMLDWAHAGSPPPGWSPGFGRSDTVVVIPTGPRCALIGTNAPLPLLESGLDEQAAAHLNTCIALQAEQRVFFGGKSFRHLNPDSAIVEGPMDFLRRRIQ